MTSRIAFFGTPEVAVPALDALLAADDLDVVAVVTNPDRPRGRSKSLVPPPVKVRALEAGLDVLQPGKPIEVVDHLVGLDLDAVAIVAYGAILPRTVLDAGGRGFVNLHFSLLPRWRGAAPVQAAVRAGDAETGVTCFVLDEGMDTGPVLRMQRTPIGPDETSGDLLQRLADSGGPVLVDAIRALVAGEEPEPQSAEGATIAPKITPADVAMDFAADADELARLVRSANPAPGAHTTFRGKRLKVWGARPTTLPQDPQDPTVEVADAPPGTVVARGDDGVLVATGDGVLLLTEVQPEGKARMDGAAFGNGYQPNADDRLGA